MTYTVLFLPGSIRRGSVSDSVAKTAASFESAGFRVDPYFDSGGLPFFNPDLEGSPGGAVLELRERLRDADAYMFCTPEYAGTLPGSLKNLLEWGIGGPMYQKPAGWINAINRGTFAEATHSTLETVLLYTGALLMPSACVVVDVVKDSIDPDGIIRDGTARLQISRALEELVRQVPLCLADRPAG